MLALVGCERTTAAPRTPDTVVLVDDLNNVERIAVKVGDQPQEFWFDGCDITRPPERSDPKSGDVIVRCTDRQAFFRFNCKALVGEANAVSFMVGLEAFRLYCR